MALQGTLDTFALPDVLRLLASTKKTGRLVIDGNRGTGNVWVDAGSVVGIGATGTIEDAGAVDILFELLRYGDGSFTFETGTTPAAPIPARSVEPLLVDAERQLTEWREIEAVVPSMDAWVTLIGEIQGDEVSITAGRWKVIVAVGSGSSVTSVGNSLRMGELDVCRQIKELVEFGLVKVSADAMPTLRSIEAAVLGDARTNGHSAPESEPVPGSGATWDPFSIEIPGVDSPARSSDEEESGVVSVVDENVDDDSTDDTEDAVDADEVAKQLASLSPKAARAVAEAAKATTDEERDAALAAAGEEDEPINRGLLLKFLSSVKS